MSMSALSVVFSVFVLSFHHRGAFTKGPPKWIKNFATCMSQILCAGVKFSTDKHLQNNGHINGKTIHQHTYNQGVPEYDALITHEIQSINQNFHNLTNSSHPTAHVQTHGSIVNISADDEIMKYFNTVVAGHEKILTEKRTIHDWQEVARVLDKVFFWTFLLITFSSSIVLLIISPMTKQISIDDYMT